jgi:hypothetical protein
MPARCTQVPEVPDLNNPVARPADSLQRTIQHTAGITARRALRPSRREVETGARLRGGPELAIPNMDCIYIHAHRGIGASEPRRDRSMGGRALAVEQPGRGKQEGLAQTDPRATPVKLLD